MLVTDWLNITILDKSAPSIGIQSPSNGRYLNEAFFVNYTVEDRESRLSNVSITYYGQTHVLEIEGKLQWMDGSYKINTAGLDDGPMDIILEAANTMGMISRKNVTVIIDRTSPIAEAGQQVTLDPGDPLTLDGTRSFDEFGISSYFWFYRSEETSIRTVIGKEAYLDRIALPGPGVYLVSLIVTDHAGNMGEDTFKVIVKEYSNRPRIIGTSLDDIHGYLKIDIVSISLYFDRPMDLDSFGSSIYFSPDALFDLGISTDGHRIDINFIASLMYDTNYTIRITGGNDTRDIKLEGCPYVLNFETESSPQKEAVDVNDDDGSPILPVILILLTLIALMGAIFFFYSRSKKEYHQEE